MTNSERIAGRSIGVLGMARSGCAVARLARQLGGEPFVSDAASASSLIEATRVLDRDSIPYETDGHTDRVLDVDYVVASPALPPHAPIIRNAQERGLPVFSEVEFASWVCPAPIVALTGTNGKTTTTALLGELLLSAGHDAHVCGNIGLPFSSVVSKLRHDSIAVVEVSSFQLHFIADFRPNAAAILNITDDHREWHGDFTAYRDAKFRIAENMTSSDLLVLNGDDPILNGPDPVTNAQRTYFSTTNDKRADARIVDDSLEIVRDGVANRLLPVAEMALRGVHNWSNAAAACLISSHFNVEFQSQAATLRSFSGVPHRLEAVGQVAGVTFINDSKATNVESAVTALRAMSQPTVLIAGGRGKGASYQPMVDVGREVVTHVVLIGEAREAMFAELGRAFAVQFADSLDAAVALAFSLANPGNVVLLSPACASFDMFDNFEARGDAFKRAVNGLHNGQEDHQSLSR